jgi:eukaryotic-like serine/threonine-protein kinase
MTSQIGKYELIKSLGHGAMGEVFLARHPAIGREVAIKTILPTAGRLEDAEVRFRREAEAAGRINHPNIVTIYDFDRDGDLLYLVMEFVQGSDLADLFTARSLGRAQLLEVLAQVCDGLAFAHSRGTIHRDIKPSNVRVIQEGGRLQAKVMDFGIARVEGSGLTATGMVMGTVSYMAPEYIQTGQATPLGDVWAVGVMLYEGLTGKPPFGSESPTSILYRIIHEPVPPLEEQDLQGVNPAIRSILAKALEKDPADRYPSAAALGQALRACKDRNWTGVTDDRTEPLLLTQSLSKGVPTSLQPSHSSRPWIMGAALALAGVLTFTALRFWPKKPTPVATTPGWTNAAGITFLPIPAGNFRMGSPEGQGEDDEHPAHPVEISQPIYMGRTPVTVEEFQRFVQATGYRTEAEQGGGASVPLGGGLMNQQADASWRNPYFKQSGKDPVVCLSWNDAKAFIAWLNASESTGIYRLPTEAEWEYACRAGSTTRYSFGDDPEQMFLHGWCDPMGAGQTHPVAEKRPNAWGLFDMHGNVWQWCEDWYDKDAYKSGPASDPKGPGQGEAKVQRGGAWNIPATSARSAYRMRNIPSLRHATFGFRVLAEGKPKAP